MKKVFLFLAMAILLIAFAGCSQTKDAVQEDDVVQEPAIEEKNTVYTIDFFHGYSLSPDGIAIYYDANWSKPKNGPTICNPEYLYGTYTIEDKALTIKFSGVDREITGVIVSDDVAIIDGVECERRTKPLYSPDEHESWAELDKVIGLSE